MFRSWFHLNFLYSVRSEFTFLHVDIQFSQHRLLKKKSILSPLNSWHHCQKSIDYKYQNFVLSIELHFLSVLMPMVTTDLLFWNFDCLNRIGIIGQKTLNWIKKRKKKTPHRQKWEEQGDLTNDLHERRTQNHCYLWDWNDFNAEKTHYIK